MRKLTARKGVDVVFEHVGADTFNGSLLCLKRGGRLVTCGSTSGPSTTINLMDRARTVGFVFVGFVLLVLRTIRVGHQRDQQLAALIQPAVEAVLANDANAASTRCCSSQTCRPCAMRSTTNLTSWGHADAFPEHFRTPEMFAESDMVQWLMHPNELNSMPEEIQLVRVFKVQEGDKLGSGVFVPLSRTCRALERGQRLDGRNLRPRVGWRKASA